jgi:DNA-binding Lrp family transcriptional regulator
MLTLTQDSAIPSLFAATHEEAYDATKKGFASWPKTKWSWGGELAERPDVFETKLHRGKTLFLAPDAARAADPLCRAALAQAESADDDGARLLRHLAAAGPSTVEDLKSELGLAAAALRKVREGLERDGAIVARGVAVEDSKGGHRHSSVLSRWDQVWRKPWKTTEDTALEELVVLGGRQTDDREPRRGRAARASRERVARRALTPGDCGGLPRRPRAGALAFRGAGRRPIDGA